MWQVGRLIEMRVLSKVIALAAGVLTLAVSPALAADDIVSNPGPFHAELNGTISLGSLTVSLPASTLDGTVAANGDITIPESGVNFNTIEVPFNGITILAKALPTGPITGVAEPSTGRMALLLSFKVQIRSGSLLPESCEVGPIVVNKLTSWLDGGSNFNAAGSGVLGKAGVYLPTIAPGACSSLTDTANNGLGLGQDNGRIQFFMQTNPLQGTGSLGEIAATDDSVQVVRSSGGGGSSSGGSKGGAGSAANGGSDSTTGPAGSSDARIVGSKIFYDEGEAYVRVACDADDGERCKGTLRIKRGKKIIGRSSYRVEAGDVSDVDVPIKIAKKTVRKGRAIKVTATLFTGMKPKKLLLDI